MSVRRRLVHVLAVGVVAGSVGGCSQLLGFSTRLPPRSGDPPVPALAVTVIDREGIVRSIRPADPVAAMNPVDAVPGPDNAIRLTWLGGACDTHATVTVEATGQAIGRFITVQTDRALWAIQGCSTTHIQRQVILELTSYIPSTEFRLSPP